MKRVGDMEVSDRGIEQVVRTDGNGYYTKLLIPKEVFIDAYKQFIEPYIKIEADKESEDKE